MARKLTLHDVTNYCYKSLEKCVATVTVRLIFLSFKKNVSLSNIIGIWCLLFGFFLFFWFFFWFWILVGFCLVFSDVAFFLIFIFTIFIVIVKQTDKLPLSHGLSKTQACVMY